MIWRWDFEECHVESVKECTASTGSESAVEKLVRLTVLFILLWGCRYGVSSNGIDHLIQYLHHFLVLAWSTHSLCAC